MPDSEQPSQLAATHQEDSSAAEVEKVAHLRAPLLAQLRACSRENKALGVTKSKKVTQLREQLLALTPELKDPPATKEEKLEEFHALTDAEYYSLHDWAKTQVWKLKDKETDNDPHNLLHDTLLNALEDGREWRPQKCDFPTFVRGGIRSISSNRSRDAKATEPPDALDSPIDSEKKMLSAIALDEFRDVLREEEHAVEFVDLKYGERCSSTEIQNRLGIDPKAYDALRMKIRRIAEQNRNRFAVSLARASQHDYYSLKKLGLVGIRRWARHYTEVLDQYEWLLQWQLPATERSQGRVVVELAIAEAQGEDLVKRIVDRIMALRDKSGEPVTPETDVD